MFEQFRNLFPLGNDKWNDYVSCFKCIKVPTKTILLHEGEISKKMFLILFSVGVPHEVDATVWSPDQRHLKCQSHLPTKIKITPIYCFTV
jgi:hypothetical protein